MSAYCVYVLKMASTDGLMPFLVACHCTIFIVNLVLYLANKFMVSDAFAELCIPVMVSIAD